MRKTNPGSSPLSISMNYVRPVMDEVERLGGNIRALWQQSDILTSLSAVLNGSITVLPAAEFIRLYRGAIGELERLCCAQEGRRATGKAMMDMLCHSVINCESVREVIARTIAFNALLEERGSRIALEEKAGAARFTLQVPERGRDTAALILDSVGLSYYYQLFSWMIGQRLQLTGVDFVHGKPEDKLPAIEIFDAPVHFEQPVNTLSFPAYYLDLPVIRSYGELLRIIDYFPFDMQFHAALGHSQPTEWSNQLRLLMLDSLQHRHLMPTLVTVAQLLHLSPATLRRRLAEEHTTFAALRAQCQREVAELLLSQSPITLDEVATRLGFSDDRSFRRAFRDWTGETPAAFRARRQVGP